MKDENKYKKTHYPTVRPKTSAMTIATPKLYNTISNPQSLAATPDVSY